MTVTSLMLKRATYSKPGDFLFHCPVVIKTKRQAKDQRLGETELGNGTTIKTLEYIHKNDNLQLSRMFRPSHDGIWYETRRLETLQ